MRAQWSPAQSRKSHSTFRFAPTEQFVPNANRSYREQASFLFDNNTGCRFFYRVCSTPISHHFLIKRCAPVFLKFLFANSPNIKFKTQFQRSLGRTVKSPRTPLKSSKRTAFGTSGKNACVFCIGISAGISNGSKIK